MTRAKRKTAEDHKRDELTINSAYGMVLYAFDDIDGSGIGFDKWTEPEIQEAAMEAAKQFISKVFK